MWFVIYYIWFYCANIAIFLQMIKDYTKEYNKKHCLFSLHYSHCEYFSKNRHLIYKSLFSIQKLHSPEVLKQYY